MTAVVRRSGVCPVCLRAYQLRVDGTMRRHSDGPGPCAGTRRLPASVVSAASVEDVPTGRFGGPRYGLPQGWQTVPDAEAAAHRAVLAAALGLRRAA